MTHRNFVVIQPGCDMSADDVLLVWDAPDCGARAYLLRRGCTEEFLRDAQPGDVMFFNREAVIMRVGRVFDGDDWS